MGVISTDAFTVSELTVDGVVRQMEDGGDRYVVGKITGTVVPTEAVNGLYIDAAVDFDTGPGGDWAFDVRLGYLSDVLEMTLDGRFSLPLPSCGDAVTAADADAAAPAPALEFTGSVEVRSSRWNVLATAVVRKLCPAVSRGVLYEVNAEVDEAEVVLGKSGVALALAPVSLRFNGTRNGAGNLMWIGTLSAHVSVEAGGGVVPSALSGSAFKVGASVVMNFTPRLDSAVTTIRFDVSEGPLAGTGGELTHLFGGDSGKGQRHTYRGGGVLSVSMKKLKIPTVTAKFSVLPSPDDAGADVYLSAESGDKSLSVGGVNFGTFTVSATRYPADPNDDTQPAGWVGTLTSRAPAVEAYLVFDTRAGTYTVGTKVKIELPGKALASGKKHAVTSTF